MFTSAKGSIGLPSEPDWPAATPAARPRQEHGPGHDVADRETDIETQNFSCPQWRPGLARLLQTGASSFFTPAGAAQDVDRPNIIPTYPTESAIKPMPCPPSTSLLVVCSSTTAWSAPSCLQAAMVAAIAPAPHAL